MLHGGNNEETRYRTLKLARDAVIYALLSFLLGLLFLSINNVKILFTDITLPAALGQVFSILYFLLFLVFSAALLLPLLMDFIEQILDWASSSVLWHSLTALTFYLAVAFILNCIVQGSITLPTLVFSLPVAYIAVGWLAYVAVIMGVDIIKPDWREVISGLLSGAANRNSDYLQNQLGREDRPGPRRVKR